MAARLDVVEAENLFLKLVGLWVEGADSTESDDLLDLVAERLRDSAPDHVAMVAAVGVARLGHMQEYLRLLEISMRSVSEGLDAAG